MGRFDRLDRMADQARTNEPARRHLRVLVISGMRALREGLQRVLEAEGCETILVDDRDNFQAVISTQRFDLVVVGHDMGDTRDIEARTKTENPTAEFRRLMPLHDELLREVIGYQRMFDFSCRILAVLIGLMKNGSPGLAERTQRIADVAQDLAQRMKIGKLDRDAISMACYVTAFHRSAAGEKVQNASPEGDGHDYDAVLLNRLDPPLPLEKVLKHDAASGDNSLSYVMKSAFYLVQAKEEGLDTATVASELRHGIGVDVDPVAVEIAIGKYMEMAGGIKPEESRASILIVDSDAAYVNLLGMRLINEGFQVSRFNDGLKALNEMEEVRPDLVIAAVNLPGLDGLTLLDRLKSGRATGGIPVILTTPKADALTVTRGLELGAEEVVKRSSDLDSLLARLNRVLGLKESNPERIASRAANLDSLGGAAKSGQRDPASLCAGSKVGDRFMLLDLLGRGGMGWVYKAKDLALDEIVALKVLREQGFEDSDVSLARFKQEIKLARKITHPHVVRIFDFMELEGIKLISMEYVEGKTLKEIIKENGPMELSFGLKVILEISAALAKAHSMGIVHRDVKPQNVIIDKKGIAKVLDFGIARMQNAEGFTRDGRSFGTPEYMSPEQIMGRSQDRRSDIYSLGCLMYELFTGKTIFFADNAMSVAMKQVKEEPEPIRNLNPSVPKALEDIIMKMLHKVPELRFNNVVEIDSAIRSAFSRKHSG
ncbi:MAG: protein kinase [Deltaproteobacteria bacterium]|nr:protein kinase [Deltaproteobacteria bacterium]